MTWPWPGDSTLDRARRVAQSYRQALADVDPELCARLDSEMLVKGQTWVVPQVVQYQEGDLLTVHEAADFCRVKPATIWEWRRRGLVSVATVDGRRYTVSALSDYQASRRARRVGGC